MLQKYPHRFELAALLAQGYKGDFACRYLAAGGSFRARCNFRNSKERVVKAPVLGARYLNFQDITRRGLNFRDKPNM